MKKFKFYRLSTRNDNSKGIVMTAQRDIKMNLTGFRKRYNQRISAPRVRIFSSGMPSHRP